MASSSHSTPKPAGGFELWAWLFMRLSGLLLLGLALWHLVIMHLLNNVDVITYDFVAARYTRRFWRGYDLLMLLLAMLHGINGARVLIDDYVRPRLWHRAALGALYVVGGTFLVLGVGVIVFFHPVVAGGHP